MADQKKIIYFQNAKNKSNSKNKKVKKIIAAVVSAIGLISSIVGIAAYFTGKDFPEYFPFGTKSADQTEASESSDAGITDYFVSVAVSDTISNNFEPAKKIVATASADTANITISSKLESESYSYGPFNMTMESSRSFSFLAVFEQSGKYIVTIAASSEGGESVTEEIIIEN